MLDLNAVTLQVRLVQDDQDQSTLAWKLATSTLPKVVAELRAAREVVATLRELFDEVSTERHYRYRCLTGRVEARVFAALAAYDQATKEST